MVVFLHPKDPFVCPKNGISPTFLFFSDGIGTQNILFDREGSGFLGISQNGFIFPKIRDENSKNI